MESHPYSALLLLKKISDPQLFTSSDRALYALLMAQAQDKCGQGLESNSFYEPQQADSMLYDHKLSLPAFQKAGDKRNCVINLIDIGYSYYMLHQYDNALRYGRKAEQKAAFLHEPMMLSTIYRLLEGVYYCQKNYFMAAHYVRLSMQTSDAYDYRKWKLYTMILLQTGELDSARFYLHKFLLSGKEQTVCYQLLQDLNEKEGRIADALHYATLVSAAKDSDEKRALAISFAGMEKRYNSERVTVENKKLIINNQRYAIGIILVLLSCFIITTIIFFERNHKKKLALRHEAAQNLIRQQQMELQTGQINKVALLQKMIQMRLIPSCNLSQIGAQFLKLFGNDETFLPTGINEIILSIDDAYNGFSFHLDAHFPNLTPREVQLCCFLRAGFEQNIILSILGIKSETYYRHRSNIRQKLGVTQDGKLEQFLSEL
jgi:tetratricopeptide (TPR) repeat protein